jgi:hypothetical protein
MQDRAQAMPPAASRYNPCVRRNLPQLLANHPRHESLENPLCPFLFYRFGIDISLAEH